MAKMHKHRLLFSKTGRARFISHLDLMRTFPRAFLRAGLDAKQTEGFNQHTFVSIALPLSLGYSSQCEILEFELLSEIPLTDVPAKMNECLPEGLSVIKCYEAENPVKQIGWLEWTCFLKFKTEISADLRKAFLELYEKDALVIQKPSKKSKKGYTEIDLIPLIHSLRFEEIKDGLVLHAVLAAQNPGLNPELLLSTAQKSIPEFSPDIIEIERTEVLDVNYNVFR